MFSVFFSLCFFFLLLLLRILMGLIILCVCFVLVEVGLLFFGVFEVNFFLFWCGLWKIFFLGIIFFSFGKGFKLGVFFDGKVCFNGGGGGLLFVGLKLFLFLLVDLGEDGFSWGNVLGIFGGNFFCKKFWWSLFWKLFFGEVVEFLWLLSCLGENVFWFLGFLGFLGDNWIGDVFVMFLFVGFFDLLEGESLFFLMIWLFLLFCFFFEFFVGCIVFLVYSLFCCSSCFIS